MADANARLIASAPDLLEVAELWLERAKAEDDRAVIEVVSAAIAKATQ